MLSTGNNNTCELKTRGEEGYCPDIAGCVDFLHNATNDFHHLRILGCIFSVHRLSH